LTGHETLTGEMRNAYKVLIAKSEKKRPLGRTIRRSDDGVLENCGVGVSCINVTKDVGQWKISVKIVMNCLLLHVRNLFIT
jgi:hypothetical protein